MAVQQFRLCLPWYKVVPVNSRIRSMYVEVEGIGVNAEDCQQPPEKLGGKYGKL